MLVYAIGTQKIRMVTHLDVSAAEAQQAADMLLQVTQRQQP